MLLTWDKDAEQCQAMRHKLYLREYHICFSLQSFGHANSVVLPAVARNNKLESRTHISRPLVDMTYYAVCFEFHVFNKTQSCEGFWQESFGGTVLYLLLGGTIHCEEQSYRSCCQALCCRRSLGLSLTHVPVATHELLQPLEYREFF